MYVDLGIPFTALLLVPCISPDGIPKQFPEDYPCIGETITATIRHYDDSVTTDGIGKIALTQVVEPAADAG